LAVLAARHRVPFLVCAPLSSIDPATADGTAIPIEERAPDEVLRFRGQLVAPEGTEAWNPAFDVTPAELISAIVTEEGVLRRPFGPAIAEAFERAAARRPERLARLADPEAEAERPQAPEPAEAGRPEPEAAS
ncbi:MAG TPA: hypothetical protein VEY67_04195, partial [Candidatus Dormibacteraeota bacterium]|nr:hypothetical protein [Candidatus Dormibacteraeota bacterium]